MSAQQTQPTAGTSGSSRSASVQQLILGAELHATSVEDALTRYEAALEQLNRHIRTLPSGSTTQAQHIQQFEQLLTTAELLKQQQQSSPTVAEYNWRQRQAKHLAEQAVAADSSGEHDQALGLYFKLLECLNRCHALETAPASQAAIMARFQVYLERAEQLRHLTKKP